MKHNLKPEVAELVIQVMKEKKQIFGKLKEDDCFCAVGCVLEAYRRKHPEICSWDQRIGLNDAFLFRGYEYTHIPEEIRFWATTNGMTPMAVNHESFTGFVFLNDTYKMPFSWFITMLSNEGEENATEKKE